MSKSSFGLANQYYEQGEYSKAIKYYDEALRDHNNSFMRSQIIRNCDIAKSKLKERIYLQCSVDVVVPVFNALPDVRRCLESLSHSRESYPFKIIIVNDGSDEETSIYLRDFVETHDSVQLIEHITNKGYTKAVNTGLRCSDSDYLVTLNSDTIVPINWIAPMLECINSDDSIGIVGPLSNAASWQNFPLLFDQDKNFSVNEIPELFDIESLNKFIQKFSTKSYPIVPFVNGFCFMLRRAVVDSIGYMDEDAFPIGYGEENDFCLRALKANFKLAIVDNIYVFHAKSKSFGNHSRKELSRKGSENIKRKHGSKYYEEKLSLIKKNKELPQIRSNLQANLSKVYHLCSRCSSKSNLKIGFILPVSGGGGGANSVIQEASEMLTMGYDTHVYVAKSAIQALLKLFADVKNIEKLLVPFDHKHVEHWSISPSSDLDSNIHYITRDRSLLVATIHTSVDLLEQICRYNKFIMPCYYAQDYEPLFYNPTESPEMYKQALDSYTKIPDNLIFAKTNWICDEIYRNHSVYVEKVRPSIDEQLYCEEAKTNPNIFRVLAMVRPATPRRGADNTMKLLKKIKLTHGANVQINIFGCDELDNEFLALERDFDYINHGVLRREEVANLSKQSDLFIDLSTYQAFGRTGLECMASGCISILPKTGGASEYVKHNVNSFCLDYPSDNLEIESLVSRLIKDRPYLEKIRSEALLTASSFSIRSSAMSEIAIFSKYLKRYVCNLSFSKSKLIYYCNSSTGVPSGSAYVRFLPLLEQSYANGDSLKFKNISEPCQAMEEVAEQVIFQRFYENISIEALQKIVDKCRSYGAKIIYDLDDYLLDIDDLLSVGINSVKARKIVDQVLFLLDTADVVVTTTPYLKKKLSSKTCNPILIHHNIVSGKLWGHPVFSSNSSRYSLCNISDFPRKVKIGFYGTPSHESDMLSFLNMLGPRFADMNCEFECVGAFQKLKDEEIAYAKRISLPKDVRYHKFVEWLKVISKDWLLGVIYLEENSFSLCKSNIKFLEYASLGLPVIVSDHPIYESIARHNHNCLVVPNEANEWLKAINLLLNNSKLRYSLAKQAYEDVRNGFTYEIGQRNCYYNL